MGLKKVLIVEDNPESLDVMTCLLEASGYEIFAARDGSEALMLLSRQVPDLIISDLQLPRIGGFELCRQIKEMDGIKDVPLIAVTALAMLGDRERVLASGFDGYLTKPINPRTFVASIASYINTRT